MSDYPFERRLGATPQRGGRTEFRVWAPSPDEVALRVNGTEHALEHAGYGIHEATVDAGAGDDYEFVLDGKAAARPLLALAAGRAARAEPRRRPGRLRLDRRRLPHPRTSPTP